jgi:hypothetical protein
MGNELVRGSKVSRTTQFNDISVGDLVVYYIIPDKMIMGTFEVTSGKKFTDKKDEVWKNFLYYEIKPIDCDDYTIDLAKVPKKLDAFDFIPNGLALQNFFPDKCCQEISKDDYQKIKSLLKDKSYSKDDDATNLPVYTALLDFYSNKATSFVSLFVASIFGIITLSAIISGITNSHQAQVSVIPFVIFSTAGYYTLQRYFSYGEIAEKLRMSCIEMPNFKCLNRALISTKPVGSYSTVYKFTHTKPSKWNIIKRILSHDNVLVCAYAITLAFIAVVIYWKFLPFLS